MATKQGNVFSNSSDRPEIPSKWLTLGSCQPQVVVDRIVQSANHPLIVGLYALSCHPLIRLMFKLNYSIGQKDKKAELVPLTTSRRISTTFGEFNMTEQWCFDTLAFMILSQETDAVSRDRLTELCGQADAQLKKNGAPTLSRKPSPSSLDLTLLCEWIYDLLCRAFGHLPVFRYLAESHLWWPRLTTSKVDHRLAQQPIPQLNTSKKLPLRFHIISHLQQQHTLVSFIPFMILSMHYPSYTLQKEEFEAPICIGPAFGTKTQCCLYVIDSVMCSLPVVYETTEYTQLCTLNAEGVSDLNNKPVHVHYVFLRRVE